MPVVMNKSVYFEKKSYLQVSTKVNVSLNWLLKPSKGIIKRKDEMENLKTLKKIIQISKSRHVLELMARQFLSASERRRFETQTYFFST